MNRALILATLDVTIASLGAVREALAQLPEVDPATEYRRATVRLRDLRDETERAERREAYEARLNHIAHVVGSTICPTCKADAGEPCQTAGGDVCKTRVHIARERYFQSTRG